MSNPNHTAMEGGNPAAQEGVKTFTQEQVNQIVSKRLAEDRVKMEAEFAKREKELQEKEFTHYATTALEKAGLPASYLDAMNTSSREAFDKALGIMIEKQNTPDERGGADPHAYQSHYAGPDPVRDAMGLQKKE